MKKLLAVFMTIFMLTVMMTSCSGYDDNTTTPTDPDKSLSIERFSAKYGINPDATKDRAEVYNGSAPFEKIQQYADYIASRGYTRDTETEEKGKADFDYIRILKGEKDSIYVNIVYSNTGVGIVDYGAECDFSSGGESTDPAPTDPTVAPTDPVTEPTDPTVTEDEKCSECHGTGKEECYSCHGTGESGYEGVKCMLCGGSGRKDCDHCLGTGNEPHPTPNPTPDPTPTNPIPTTPNPDPNPQTKCPICNNGQVTCSTCNGTGTITQSVFVPDYGTGGGYREEQVTCPRCHGRCTVNCTHCGGDGIL